MTIKLSKLLEDLREDHRNLTRLLDRLEAEAGGIGVDGDPDFELLHDIMQYLTVYTDAVHHRKEDLLYGRIRESGAELAEGLDGVEAEHREIAKLGARLRDDIEAIISGTAVTRYRLRADVQNYVAVLRRHMAWEDDDLFPRAEDLAAANGDAGIDVSLLSDDDPLFGRARSASFQNLLTYLQKFE